MASAEADWRTGKSLNQCIAYMLNSTTYYDVTFQLHYKDKPRQSPVFVRALKALLIARSSVFERMFTGGLAETQDVIPVTDIDPHTFYELLRFIYTDDVKLSEENVMQVMYVANKYLVTGLTSRCVNFLEQRLNPTNAAMLLEQSMLFEAKALQERCLRTIQEQTSRVFATQDFLTSSREVVKRVLESDYLAAPEIEVFEACVAWAKKKLQGEGTEVTPDNMKVTLGEMLYLVRFPAMNVDEFANRVLPHNLLDDKDILALFKHFNCKDKPEELPFNRESRNKMAFNSTSQFQFRKLVTCRWCGDSIEMTPMRKNKEMKMMRKNKHSLYCNRCGQHQ